MVTRRHEEVLVFCDGRTSVPEERKKIEHLVEEKRPREKGRNVVRETREA